MLLSEIRDALGTAHMVNQTAFEALLQKLPEWLNQDTEPNMKIAMGVFTPTGGSDDVVTGLGTVVYAGLVFTTAPTLTHMWSAATIGDQAGAPAAGSIRIASRKPTTNTNVTPIAATTPWVPLYWFAVGTP